MGLAASQARFLAITSRKMNCEFQSMQIAQDKLSVTRDLQSAATKYQNSMNATKLVWDTDMDEVYDLSYDLLMTPSALNDYNPYLITDAQGKIVLTDSMFNAAYNAGIINENGDPTGAALFTQSGKNIDVQNPDGTVSQVWKSDGSRDAFLNALVTSGDLAATTADSVKAVNDGNSYTNSGIGGEILDKTIANALTTTGLISELSSKDEDGNLKYSVVDAFIPDSKYSYSDTNSDGTISDDEKASQKAAKIDGLMDGMFCYTTSPDKIDVAPPGGTMGQYIIAQNGTALTRDQIKELSLGDLLSGKYTITKVGSSNMEVKPEILTKLAAALGQGYTGDGSKGLNVDTESNNALTTALDFTHQHYISDATTVSGGTTYNKITNSINQAHNYNGVVHSDVGETISLTNLLKSYLTSFAIAIDGAESTLFNIESSAGSSKYVTDDLNYYFLIEEGGAVTETDLLTADFYNQLYNQICLNGATTDAIKRDMVSDPEYLMQALKNGQLFISSLNTDGYFYQGAYTLNGYVAEVTDEEAIAQAEMEYEITKSKLNYKEETLDLKMKNIDTELSALTTEYDTVKNLISKNVEKVFTMFST